MRISDKAKAELLALDPEKLTVNMITKLFGYTTKKGSFEVIPPKFVTTDILSLKAGEYINTTDIETTVGSVLFNKLLVEGSHIESIIPGGFYNEEMVAKKFDKFCQIVADAVRADKIPIDPTLVTFLSNYENWGMRLSPIFSHSYSMSMIKPNPKMKETTEKTLAKTNLKTTEGMIQVEDELVKVADQLTEGDYGKTIFMSGARGSFANDFKNMALFIGPIQNPVNGQYDFMTSNYIGGLKKQDLVGAGNIVVGAEYPKAIGTARGGYITKQLYAVLQTLVVDDELVDCGSKSGIRVTLTPQNASDYEDQYIMTTKGPYWLSAENISKFYGKSVLVRSPMGCISDKICKVCAGKRFEQMGISTMGLLLVNVSNTMMNKNLKLRHSMKMNVDVVDVDKLVI